jgi:hypothetical protein
MAKGILETVGLALTLVFAIPVALLGAQFLLLEGRPLFGVAFLAIAVLMVVIEEYLTTPTDLPSLLFGRTVETVVEEPSEGANAPSETSDADETD